MSSVSLCWGAGIREVSVRVLVVVKWHVLRWSEPKFGVPIIVIELNLFRISCRDCLEPVIKNNMVLRGYLSDIQINDKRNRV